MGVRSSRPDRGFLNQLLVFALLFAGGCAYFEPASEEEFEITTFEVAEIKEDIPPTVVVIDPGHGGVDGGAVGTRGTLEKEITLKVARQLEKALEQYPNIQAELTRNADVQMSLAERTEYANKLGADFLISLHANASGTEGPSGFEAYYLDVAGDKASRRLAAIENDIQGKELGDLEFILSDLLQRGKLNDSILLAHNIESQVVSTLHKRWSKVRSHGVKKAPFYVLMGAHMPCVLLEMFFLDNPDDESLLLRKDFRVALARSIADGIFKTLDSQSEKSF